MLVVQPVGDALGQGLPIGLVLEDVLPALAVELRHAVRLDLLLAADVQRALHLDLDREAVRVPPRDARDAVPQHRLIPANEILDGAREDVMDPRPAVRRGGALEEDEGRVVARRLLDAREQPLVLPGREELFLQRIRRKGGIENGVRHQFKRSSTPRISPVSLGSAPRATARILSTDAG